MRAVTATAALVLLLQGSEAAAQTSDAKLWLSGSADVDVSRRVEMSVEQELRVGAASAFDQTHTEVAAEYRVTRRVRLGALYRLIIRDDETRHRGAAGGELSGSAGRFRFGYRLRLQATTRPGNDAQILVRNRGKIEYRLAKRLLPFASLELHHQLAPNDEFRELRLVLGIEWKLATGFDLTGYYVYQRETNVANPERNHVLGMGGAYHFGR